MVISAVPKAWWLQFIIMTAFRSQLTIWEVSAKASRLHLPDMFPLSNCMGHMQKPFIEYCLCGNNGDYPELNCCFAFAL